jgi:hypothetical protein
VGHFGGLVEEFAASDFELDGFPDELLHLFADFCHRGLLIGEFPSSRSALKDG